MFNINAVKEYFPLTSENIELRLFSESDIADDYITWLNDPETVRYSNQRFIKHSIESSASYFNSFKGTDHLFVLIADKETGVPVGTMTVYIYPMHSTAEVGILIGNKDYLGKGIGQEAWNRLINFLLHYADLRKVFAGTLVCNTAMMKIIKNSGMNEDGIFKNHEVVDGEVFDVINFAIYKESK